LIFNNGCVYGNKQSGTARVLHEFDGGDLQELSMAADSTSSITNFYQYMKFDAPTYPNQPADNMYYRSNLLEDCYVALAG